MADEKKVRLDKRHVLYEKHKIGYPRARRKVVFPAGSSVDAATARRLGIKATKAKSDDSKKKEPENTPETGVAGDLADQVKELSGGWYELPDGTKVQGKKNLAQALKELAAAGSASDSD